MQDTTTRYTEYQTLAQKAADLNYAAAVLGWDQETYMPPKGFPYRGRQLATLASAAHEILTSEKYGNLLTELAEAKELSNSQRRNVQLSLEDYEKARKLPSEFVEAVTQQTSYSLDAWLKAREANDYSLYAPELQKMIALKKQQADLYGYEAHPYDALLDDYEKGGSVAILDPVFETVKEKLPQLLAAISKAQQVDDAFFYRHYPKEAQWNFSMEVLKSMGYDFEAGRQDYSEHPFTTSFAPTDVRVTTRVDEKNFASMLWSSIHEGGHALYEQGLPESEYGMPLGTFASLSMHESQSRLWENCVGRSLPFWNHFFPKAQKFFPDQLKDISPETWYRGANKVESSFIRTEADELTYHFHVLIRYEIEKALLTGELDPKDLSAAWNEHYQKYLGITPPDAAKGVLQDVHWAHGSFGYFPTYSLGSFYAAQFFEQAEKEIQDLTGQIGKAEFGPLLQWLREKLHRHGRYYNSEELCTAITGRGLDFSSFYRYAEQKYSAIYQLSPQPLSAL